MLVAVAVAVAVDGLMGQSAAGCLAVDGALGGAIYLDQGQIIFARSSWSPDLAARLRAVLPVTAGSQEMPVSAADDDIAARLLALDGVSGKDLAAFSRPSPSTPSSR